MTKRDSFLFAGTVFGVYRSSDDGSFWERETTGLGTPPINSLIVASENVCGGVGSGLGVVRTTNNGAAWDTINAGLTASLSVFSLSLNAEYLFAGGEVGSSISIWRRPIIQVPVIEQLGLIPLNLSLVQNYPNPFNPSTTILYEVPRRSRVELIIYNIIGQKVTTLFDEEKEAGRYSVVWSGRNETGSDVGSGVYFSCFRAEGYVAVRKLMLVR